MQYTTYRQIDQKVDQLFDEQKYSEVIELLEKAREQFPLFTKLFYIIPTIALAGVPFS